MIYRCVLPLPPSVNASFMPVVRGRLPNGQPRAIIAPTKALEEFKRDALKVLEQVGRAPIAGPVEFFAEFYLPSIASDCSNRIKACEDVLSGYAYADDKQIVEDHAFKRVALAEEDQRVIVVVRPADWVEHMEVAKRLVTSAEAAKKKAAREEAREAQTSLLSGGNAVANGARSATARDPEVFLPQDVDRVQPAHYVGDSCPGGHEKLAGARLDGLGPRRDFRELATPATYGTKR